ncbi:MAG: acyl-CoA reductase [Saprospiraceae bacterium]|nr:acyl-CoA reductase [Saprospiraceae bacterium]
MNLSQRLELMVKLGEFLAAENEFLDALIHQTHYHNQWFTTENYKQALEAIRSSFLSREKLESWLRNYQIPESNEPKTVGLVLAGNIPLVGFHDIMTTFMAGHYCQIKPSSKDQFVLPYLLKEIVKWEPGAAPYFQLVDQLQNLDAVIATGSNNSARYFETYFGKYPHIIRKNRNAVAVLNGTESAETFLKLGKDIFGYFGLGCRNVSKLYVPEGYNFSPLLEALHEFRHLVMHSKYKNNFDYNFALFSLNRKAFLSNGCVMLIEDESLQSRIAVLHYEYYQDYESLQSELESRKDEIQLVVSDQILWSGPSAPFGEAQSPALDDYADGVDTLKFLQEQI